MTTTQHLILIGLIALTSTAPRFLPFLLFPAGREAPPIVRHLGDVLPGAIYSLLLVYCLKNVDIVSGSHGLPEALALAVTAGLHLWKRNMLISISGGTVCYMLLVQLVF